MTETLENRLNLWLSITKLERQREQQDYQAYSGMSEEEAAEAFELRHGKQPEVIENHGAVILCGPVTV